MKLRYRIIIVLWCLNIFVAFGRMIKVGYREAYRIGYMKRQVDDNVAINPIRYDTTADDTLMTKL